MKRTMGCAALIAIAISVVKITPPKTIAITGRASAPAAISPTIKKLIRCESQGQNIARIDSNGKMSYGILQFQASTWSDFSKQSGITGSPMDEDDAIAMARWAIHHGYLGRWSCAHILGMVRN